MAVLSGVICVCVLKKFFWCDAAIPISIFRPLRETSSPKKTPPAALLLPPKKNTWRMRLTTPLEWTARLPTRKVRTAGGGISSRLPIRRRTFWLDGRDRPKNQRISRRRNFTNISFAVTTRPIQAVSRRLVGEKKRSSTPTQHGAASLTPLSPGFKVLYGCVVQERHQNSDIPHERHTHLHASTATDKRHKFGPAVEVSRKK